MNANVVLRDPRRPQGPVDADAPGRPGPRPLGRRGHPDRRGPVDASPSRRGATRSRPGGTSAEIKVAAGVDVELMLEEGAAAPGAGRAGRPRHRAGRKRAARRRDGAARRRRRPVEARLAAADSTDVVATLAEQPLRDFVTASERMPLWVDRERALFGTWYEFFPRSEGARLDPKTGVTAVGHLPHRDGAAARGRGDGLRRRLPAADPPDRDDQPQGAEQHADPRPGRPRLPVGDRRRRGRPRRDPPRPRHDRGLRRLRRPGRASSGWRSRSTSRCSARPTTRGSRSTRSGSPRAPTARSPTPRTRRRSTRTSTRSTSTTTPRASTPRCCASLRHWMDHGVRIFRVDNPHTKPVDFWEWLIARGPQAPTPTCSSWPRRSPGRR